LILITSLTWSIANFIKQYAMRNQLKPHEGERMAFIAVVERFGAKTNYHGYSDDTMLLKDIRFAGTGELATGHLWFTVGKSMEKLKLAIGDRIQFEARISEYSKGYVNRRGGIDNRKTDYKLSRPTKFMLLK
jgi:hypothetical protein